MSSTKPKTWPIFKCPRCQYKLADAFGPNNSCVECGGGSTRLPDDKQSDGEEEEEAAEIDEKTEARLRSHFTNPRSSGEEEDDDVGFFEYSKCRGCGEDLDEIDGDRFLHILEARPAQNGTIIPAYGALSVSFCSWSCLVAVAKSSKNA